MLRPPVGLVLAREVREIPGPDPRWAYEPKFDGWRAVVFAADGVLQSRRNNDLAARFPEIIAAVRPLGDVVVDGELVALREGRLDFGSLVAMPASRAAAGVVEMEADATVMSFTARLRPRVHRLRTDLAPEDVHPE